MQAVAIGLEERFRSTKPRARNEPLPLEKCVCVTLACSSVCHYCCITLNKPSSRQEKFSGQQLSLIKSLGVNMSGLGSMNPAPYFISDTGKSDKEMRPSLLAFVHKVISNITITISFFSRPVAAFTPSGPQFCRKKIKSSVV